MSYLNVITLAEAKVYLRVDDSLTEDDSNIERMIVTALKYIEGYTNMYVYARDKNYLFNNGLARVYTYPINSVISPTDNLNTYEMGLYNDYVTTVSSNSMLSLNVGYTDPDDVPQDLREVAFEIIDILYYGKETGRTMEDLSPLAMAILNQNKRFIL